MNVISRSEILQTPILSLCRDSLWGLPYAAGAILTDDEIYGIAGTTREQCAILGDGNDRGWLDSLSVQRAELLTAYIHGKKIRKFGGLYRGTHPLDVAHRAANFHSGQTWNYGPEDREIRAFLGLNHDNPEDGGKDDHTREIIFSLVKACWVGNPALLDKLEKDTRDLTDSLGLKDAEKRHQEQIERAWRMSREAIVVRNCDKLGNTFGDALLVDQGLISDPEEIIARAELARSKVAIVEALPAPINDVDRKLYLKYTEFLEAAALLARRDLALLQIASTAHNKPREMSSGLGQLARSFML